MTHQPPVETILITTTDAARLTGLSIATIQRRIDDGRPITLPWGESWVLDGHREDRPQDRQSDGKKRFRWMVTVPKRLVDEGPLPPDEAGAASIALATDAAEAFPQAAEAFSQAAEASEPLLTITQYRQLMLAPVLAQLEEAHTQVERRGRVTDKLYQQLAEKERQIGRLEGQVEGQAALIADYDALRGAVAALAAANIDTKRQLDESERLASSLSAEVARLQTAAQAVGRWRRLLRRLGW